MPGEPRPPTMHTQSRNELREAVFASSASARPFLPCPKGQYRAGRTNVRICAAAEIPNAKRSGHVDQASMPSGNATTIELEVSMKRKLLMSGVAALIAIAGLCRAPDQAQAQQQQQQKPNILFIMGDDIGIDAAEHLSSWPDGRGNAQHRSHRQRRCDVHGTITPSRAARRAVMPSSPACIRCAPA